MSTILFIDGQNFKGEIGEVFKSANKPTPQWHEYDFAGLINHVLKGIQIDRKIFYSAKISIHPSTVKKSKELIQAQRLLKTHLEKQGFEYIIAGRVRGQPEKKLLGRPALIFREKGVDVKLAVDMVTMSCDGHLKQAIIGSSDSDLQPAVREIVGRGVETVYLGFEIEPNKGLSFTTKRQFLIRNSEVLQFEKIPQLPLQQKPPTYASK